MKILQKEYDPVIGANVITRYEKPLYYLDFDNVNESKLDENNPKPKFLLIWSIINLIFILSVVPILGLVIAFLQRRASLRKNSVLLYRLSFAINTAITIFGILAIIIYFILNK